MKIHYLAQAARRKFTCLLINVSFLLAGSQAQANLINNGGFEMPSIPSGSFINIYEGNKPTELAWKITNLTVDIFSNGVLGSSATVYEGVQALNLAGVGSEGGIAQTFPTFSGKNYVLSFAFSGNPFRGTHRSALVNLDDGSTSLFSQSISHNTATTSNFDWVLFETQFIGTGNPITLSFKNESGLNASGILLDAISIRPIPLPGAYWFLSCGLGIFGILRHNTRNSRKHILLEKAPI